MKQPDYYARKISGLLMKYTDKEAIDGQIRKETIRNQIDGLSMVSIVLAQLLNPAFKRPNGQFKQGG